MKLALLVAAVGISQTCFAADPLALSRVAELSLHRIERLVILKKIDPSYETAFQGLAVEALTPQTATDPSFRVETGQVPGASGARRSLKFDMDAIGKELSHVAIDGPAAAGAPAWPDADAVTLAENALHWLEAQGPAVAELAAYFNSLRTLSLTPGTDPASGKDAALVEITTAESAAPGGKVLRIWMTLQGNFGSYALVARP